MTAAHAVVAVPKRPEAGCEETVRALPDDGARWSRERNYYRGYAFALRHAADLIETAASHVPPTSEEQQR